MDERLTRLKTFLKWCVGEGYLEKNPAEGIQVEVITESYQPFTKGDLQALFSPTSYARADKPWQF